MGIGWTLLQAKASLQADSSKVSQLTLTLEYRVYGMRGLIQKRAIWMNLSACPLPLGIRLPCFSYIYKSKKKEWKPKAFDGIWPVLNHVVWIKLS